MEKTRESKSNSVLASVLILAWSLHYLWLTRHRDGFTWMDPYQYFGFAQAVLNGARPWNGFEVASIFPYFLLPGMWLGNGTVPSGLVAHVWITLALLGVFMWFSRELGRREYWWILCILWLGTPLVIGLSHELYVETALTLFVTASLTAAWRAARRGGWKLAALAGALWGLTIMLKTTAPVFFVGPVLVLATWALREGAPGKRFRATLKLGAAYAAGLALVALTEITVFSASWDYWRSLGNTSIPIMRLIGPGEFGLVGALTYYPRVLLTLGLPLGILAAVPLGAMVILGWTKKNDAPFTGTDPAAERAKFIYLLAWLLVPLVVFTIQPVKEPRHILPCLPAFLMLILNGVGRLPAGLARKFWLSMVPVAVIGYGWATHTGSAPGGGPFPYYTQGATGALGAASLVTKELTPVMLGVAEGGGQVPSLDLWVRYSLDVAVTGLPPNEALALAWALRPAIVHNLDDPPGLARLRNTLPVNRFEDLYVYSAFNLYNARCGLPGRYDWVDRTNHFTRPSAPRVVIRTAEREHPYAGYASSSGTVVIPEDPPSRVFRVERPGNPAGALYIDVFDLPPGAPDSRQSYAWMHLLTQPRMDPAEQQTVLASLRRGYLLRKDWEGLRLASTEYPQLRTADLEPGRNIYWFGFYPGLAIIEQLLWANSPFHEKAIESGDAAPVEP